MILFNYMLFWKTYNFLEDHCSNILFSTMTPFFLAQKDILGSLPTLYATKDKFPSLHILLRNSFCALAQPLLTKHIYQSFLSCLRKLSLMKIDTEIVWSAARQLSNTVHFIGFAAPSPSLRYMLFKGIKQALLFLNIHICVKQFLYLSQYIQVPLG